jgi:hypothetical protein
MMNLCNRGRCLAALTLGWMLLVPATAGAVEQEIPLDGRGLYMAGVGFFSAFPSQSGGDSLVLHYGDLDTVSWVPGMLPVVDAHVLMVNASGRLVPEVKVKVSMFLGVGSISTLPPEDEISPGMDGLEESLFFERVFSVKKFEHATLRRVGLHDIALNEAVVDRMRQGLWPAYLRVEAHIVGKPDWVDATKPGTTDFLKIYPRATAPAQPGAPAAARPEEEQPES